MATLKDIIRLAGIDAEVLESRNSNVRFEGSVKSARDAIKTVLEQLSLWKKSRKESLVLSMIGNLREAELNSVYARKIVEREGLSEDSDIDEASRGFEPGVGEMMRRGDIALGQALGHLWKASDGFRAAGLKGFNNKVVDLINGISRFMKDSDPEYEKAILKVARTVEKRGSKF